MELMAKYNVPANHVIRHYDVVGKICSNPYVYNTGKHTWDTFKSAISFGACQEGFIRAADGKRWWYQYKDGTYPTGWAYLTEKTGGTSGWYLFDRDGYMLTGHQTAPDGKKYFLCPERGIYEGQCMVTDSQGKLIIAGYDMAAGKYAI